MKNCYIHIPFCDNICSYCDFCKVFYKEELVDKYLEALEKEIRKIYRGEELETIYIGGGTPSSLSVKQLKKLFEIIKIFNVSCNISKTIECNFENITEEKLELFRENKINRLSFGVESVNKNNLELLGRKSNKEEIIKIINECRNKGFFDINVDLIYAVPGESIEILNEDLDFVFSLGVNHISTYSLIIENHTKLAIEKVENISEDLDSLMYEVICQRMKDEGYKHYEISNFCKEGYESVHNLCYWNNDNYYGFGLGASSYIDNVRCVNTRSFSKYLSGKYQYNREVLSKKEIMEYEVMLNLRRKKGINKMEFYQKYGVKVEDVFNVEELLKEKLLKSREGYLFIEENKWYISNEIIIRLLEE